MLRIYAQILGLVLILVGLVGLLLGERVWLGVLNVDLFEESSTWSRAGCWPSWVCRSEAASTLEAWSGAWG
jgi:xanthosine utilization system XapX-like protein